MKFLLDYYQHFGLYEYVAYGLVSLAFFVLFIISLILLFKRPLGALVLILLIFISVVPSFLATKYFIDEKIKKVKITNIQTKKLHFMNSLLVKAVVENNSKFDFSKCYIKAKVLKKEKNSLDKIKNFFKPLIVKEKVIENLKRFQKTEIKFIFDDFYLNNYKVSLKGSCF